MHSRKSGKNKTKGGYFMKAELLTWKLKGECPEGLEKTFIGEVSIPTHKALRQFFEERLRGEHFESKGEIAERLAEWPTFALSHEVPYLAKEFREIRIEGENIACPGGMGGSFVIGTIAR
jgi:hypothetical protein